MFKDKISIVTGASQGIGKAIADLLAQEGARVILWDIQEEKLKDLAQEIQTRGGQADFQQVDVSKLAEVEEAAKTALDHYGQIDHLVNNAGITRDNLLMRMSEEEWDLVFQVNLKGVFNCCKAVIRAMMSRRQGRIVNIASVVGLMGNLGQTNYAASKAGVIGFTKSLAREVAARNITVNAVAPGYILTPMTEILSEQTKHMFLNLIPLKKFGRPEDVAKAVRFLLSEDAAYITGQVLNVNGGMYM
ncbi:MAG: 3-oxoacyl-ACP reductase [Candidatus Aminicenantes bacterium 4484_214]|nr:MAG: 3-oxoacyl-ACP reductase [Candidatus Aminicenantes bacterium 4484_214]RLE07266.1 MAG: 3-oxoacyl-ACP reductase [Candidatus Aminicenantes bacterium]